MKHWVLYTLDAIESEGLEMEDQMDPRVTGSTPKRIYAYAGGDDSIVFRNKQEVSTALSEMGRMAPFYENENRPVNRRSLETEWDEADVHYVYRLTDFGRRVLLDLGVPDQLPNRREEDFDRDLVVEPSHRIGWWSEEFAHYGSEWDIRNNDWNETDHERVFYRDSASELFEDRGFLTFAKWIADQVPEATLVCSVGPYRGYDMQYVIRDPWRKVVHVDFYSPMTRFRDGETIKENLRGLVSDLRRGLESVHEVDDA